VTFFVLGVPDGLLGVAWPQLRRAHHEPASALSVLLLCGTGAYFLSSTLSGRAGRRFRSGTVLAGATATAALGALAVATSPQFRLVAVGVALLGAAGGLVDPVLSSIASLSGNGQLIGLMHALYAVGAAGAPLLIAASTAPSGWRVGYLAVAAAYGLLLAVWTAPATRRALPTITPRPSAEFVPRKRANGILLPLAAFFVASGLEIAVASWSAVYVTDALGRSSGSASLAVLGYWSALSIARVVGGIYGSRRPQVWLGGASLVALAGAVAFWSSPHLPVTVIGLLLLGAGIGPLLPLLTVLTPQRVGEHAAADVIGWQLAAASVGTAVVAGGVGLVVHHSGVSGIAPALAVTAFVTAALLLTLNHGTAAR
jgi:fucose permease